MIDLQMISKAEKIDLIKELAENNHISPYQIGSETEISISSAQKIFSGDQKNPRNKTLNIILDYIEKTITGTKGSIELTEENIYKAAEPEIIYDNFKSLSIEEKLNKIYKQNIEINKKLSLLTNKD